jgi:hypothetical protein
MPWLVAIAYAILGAGGALVLGILIAIYLFR